MEKAFRIAFDFTHDTEEAKDLSQEAFLRAFRGLSNLTADLVFIPGFTDSW